MKSVDIERRRARRFAVGFAFSSVIIGFVACGGSDEHKAAPRNDYPGAGESAGGSAAGGASQHAGGSQNLAGESNDGGMSGGNAGGAAGGTSLGGAAGEAGRGNGAGAGGDLGAGGVAGAGGQASAGEGGNGGAGGDGIFVDPVCGVNMVKVGEYSLWCGKVNEHTDADGLWQWDADCSSGCNVKGVTYCQKFYPSATAVVDVPQLVTKDWKNAGCADSTPDGPGVSGQAACCAPL